MKVLNWRGKEHDYAKDYVNGGNNNKDTLDVFKEYNRFTDKVIKSCYGTLALSYDRIAEVQSKMKSADDEIDNLNAKLKKVKDEMQMAGHNKNANLNEIIENKKLEFIKNSAVHSELDISSARANADNEYSKYENVGNLIDMEEIRRKVLEDTGSAGEVSLATKGAIDFYGRTYGEFDNQNNGWSSEFTDLYRGIVSSVKADGTVMDRVSAEMYTKKSILNKLHNSYKKNPYVLLKILLYMVCFPVAFYKYKYSEKSVLKCITCIVSDIKNNNGTYLYATFIMLWLAQWIIIASGHKPIKLIVFSILCLIVYLIFNISKKKITQVVREFVEIEYCYGSVISSMDKMIEDEFNKRKEELSGDILKSYKYWNDMYDKMVAENEEAARRAEQMFDPNSIDKKDLERDHANLISSLRNQLISIENSIESCKMNKAKMMEENREYIQKYQVAKDEVRKHLSADNNNDAFDIDGSKYNFIFGQLDAQVILTSTKVINPIGMPTSLTGKIVNSVEEYSDVKSDLPPVTIPIKLREVSKSDLKNICSAYNWYEAVYSELVSIMADVNKDVIRVIGNQDANIDFSKFYKFDVLEHGLRCAVMFYNSKEDVNSHRTVANVCTHNIIHPAICTTDMRGLSFRIFPKDRTSFDSMDYSLGASIEERNSMISNHFYEVYDSSDRDKVLSELYSNSLALAKEIGSNSKNIIEYRAKKINGGSSPTRVTYLIFTDDVSKYWTDTLRSILYGTGGTQTGGHDVYGENTYGIVPILFIDLAPLYEEKPDTTIADTISNIAMSIPMDNFFYVGSGAETLRKYNRNEVLRIVEQSLSKAK